VKIALSAASPDLDGDVEPRFGRAPYFVIVDPATMQFEATDNSASMAAGGAGISTAQMIAGKGAEVVLTGNCGPNAYQTLSAAGIQVVTGVSGPIRDAVEAYGAGRFRASTQASVGDHYGMGMGSGGGMGRGRGMGMGRGLGLGSGAPPMAEPSAGGTNQEEVSLLRNETQMLRRQLAEMQKRLEELEGRR